MYYYMHTLSGIILIKLHIYYKTYRWWAFLKYDHHQFSWL